MKFVCRVWNLKLKSIIVLTPFENSILIVRIKRICSFDKYLFIELPNSPHDGRC